MCNARQSQCCQTHWTLRLWMLSGALLFWLGSVAPVQAIEWSWSSFATLGYAVSDHDETFLRHIDRDGTFMVDSVAGTQIDGHHDADFGRIGVTFQGVVRNSTDRDHDLEPALSWAFTSYRPNNDWLFRLGKFRTPVFIFTQNMEVGVTYDQARLPVEFYSISPNFDIFGVSTAYNWSALGGEMTLEGYFGENVYSWRIFSRAAQRASYTKQDLDLNGLVLSWRDDALMLQWGIHRGRSKIQKGQYTDTFEPRTIPAPEPVGGTLYVPVRPISVIHTTALTFGLDWRFADQWRLTSEYGLRIMDDMLIGVSSQGAYATLARTIDDWTPYVSVAGLRSSKDNMQLGRMIEATPVPLASGLPATYHQSLVDNINTWDQTSYMLGVSYALTPTSRLKAEWMLTHVGQSSRLFDHEYSGMNDNVFSISYSWVH
ncbi:MAG: hypothetical protein HQL92_03105 [Magnetococcales bacterium]|nr:hypothetical protein [Magnetococcales bacterium]